MLKTPIFAMAYGQVTLAGRPAPEGSFVQAYDQDGWLVGCTTVQTAGHFGVMRLYAREETGPDGMPIFLLPQDIVWVVNGIEMESSAELTDLQQWEVYEVDLSGMPFMQRLPVLLKGSH